MNVNDLLHRFAVAVSFRGGNATRLLAVFAKNPTPKANRAGQTSAEADAWLTARCHQRGQKRKKSAPATARPFQLNHSDALKSRA
jgi:hypothetical protein